MASENVRTFEELLRDDDALQAKLQELASAFDGDKTDERAIFDATIGKLAADAGLPFTYEEGRDAIRAERELSDSELDAVAGGEGFCYFIGGSDTIEADCGGDVEGYACIYVGVTL